MTSRKRLGKIPERKDIYLDKFGNLHHSRYEAKKFGKVEEIHFLRNKSEEKDNEKGGMDEGAYILASMILEGITMGKPQIGFLTNPNVDNVPHFIEVNGQKVVCLAKGGECRFNDKYYDRYGGGLNSAKSWVTPIIDHSCPNRCPSKYIVCDEHPKHPECSQKVRFYPVHNKYIGEFTWYCKNFKLLNENEDQEDKEIEKEKDVK